jgi:hypothetical protein
MSRIKALRLYKWVILSVIFQVIILMFFNNVYLNNRGEATMTLLPTDDQQSSKKQVITVSIPKDATDIKVSYDSGYVGYMLDKKLEVYDIKAKKVAKSISLKSDIITNFHWLSDRNTLVYATRTPDEVPGAVQVITYSMDTDVQHDYPKISGLPRKSEIVSIDLSHLTNTIYTLVKTSATEAKIYRYNVMSQLYHISNTSAETIIKNMQYTDKLVYQDGRNNKVNIFTWNEPRGSTANLSLKNKAVLLKVAGSDDEMFFGELNSDNKVSKVIYGKEKESPDNWKSLALKTPALPENIVVTSVGDILELDENKKIVYNLSKNKNTSYKGKLIEVTDGQIVSMDNNELKIIEFSNN